MRSFVSQWGDLLEIDVTFKKTKDFNGTLGLFAKTDFKKSYTSILVSNQNISVSRVYDGIDFMEDLKTVTPVFDFDNEDTI